MISASIVLYNTPFEDVIGAIRDFLGAGYSGHLFLIDNSPCESPRILGYSATDERIEYIFLDQNVGYGKAHNVAMKKARSLGYQFHVILNPDIRFDSNIIEGLYRKILLDKSIAHIMPKICYPDGSIQYLCKLLPSPFDLLFRRFVPLACLRERLAYYYELRCYDYEKDLIDVPSLSGCFMFLRLEFVANVGYFDDRIFMYMEDVDLTRRLLRLYSNLYCPQFTVFHKYEKGSYKNKKLLRYHMRSAVYYFSKWGWVFDKYRRKANLDFKRKNKAKSLVSPGH